jgi:hypothetical protein
MSLLRAISTPYARHFILAPRSGTPQTSRHRPVYPVIPTMRTHLLLLSLLFTAALSAADLPTGRATPEGVACDALMAYINRDSKAWLATLVRPAYGDKGNSEYADFKKQMAEGADKAKADPNFKAPRLTKCFKARQFSMNGPGSAAYAVGSFTGNMFVDMMIEIEPGKSQRLRYHVLKDKDDQWYFEPRPDLCPLFSVGLNEESASTEILYEAP